jgi:putative hydrolase of the HAD superfamily
MRRPLGVIFDLGDTLLRTTATDWAAGSTRLLALANDARGITAADIKALSDEIANEVFSAREESALELHYDDFVKLLCETLGMSLKVNYVEAAREMWRAAVTMAPTEGVAGVLESLRARGLKMGVLSNSAFPGVVLAEELERHAMGQFFSFVISSADYGLRKPHRRIVDLVVKKMELRSDDIWFVGDRLEFDVAGAINSGLCAVWYNPSHSPRTGSHQCLEISDWHEFRDMVETLSRVR